MVYCTIFEECQRRLDTLCWMKLHHITTGDEWSLWTSLLYLILDTVVYSPHVRTIVIALPPTLTPDYPLSGKFLSARDANSFNII